MGRRAFIAGLCCLFVVTVAQSQTTNPACPALEITSSELVSEGTDITFTIKVTGGDPNVKPTYNWSVSAGTIKSGQGTSVIKVDTTGLGDQSVTATVELGGYDPVCERVKSSTSTVEKKPASTKSDEYSSTDVKLETERLDRFARALMEEPNVNGYIMSYGGRVGKTGEAQALADRTKKYLVSRGIDESRLVTVDGGFREQLTTELWLVPPGAAPPQAEPTVDPKEVKQIKETPKTTTSPTKPRPKKG
jgi:hypothetical protein